jgi:hypothetical protein
VPTEKRKASMGLQTGRGRQNLRVCVWPLLLPFRRIRLVLSALLTAEAARVFLGLPGELEPVSLRVMGEIDGGKNVPVWPGFREFASRDRFTAQNLSPDCARVTMADAAAV